MPVKIKSTGGGSVTIDVPSTAVDTTMMLPVTNAGLVSNTNPVMTGNVAITGNVSVSGANSYISINGDNLSPYSMRNKIINGDFRIFQRNAGAATLVTNNGVGYTGPDRFFVYQNGTLGVQSSQVVSGLSGFQYALKWGRPTSNTTTGITVLGQTLETTNSIDLQGQQVTLSFWAKAGANFSAASSQIYVAVYSGTGTDQSASSMTTASWTGSATPISTMVTLTGTWQKFTLTGTLGSTISQLGLYMNWTPVGTAGADDYVYITGVQLEQGPIATPFERRPFGMELALCQRYYEKSYDIGTVPATATTVGAISTFPATYAVYFPISYKVQKRAVPTVTLYSIQNGATGVYNYNGVTNVALSGTISSGMFGCCPFTGSAPGNVAGYIHFVAEAEL